MTAKAESQEIQFSDQDGKKVPYPNKIQLRLDKYYDFKRAAKEENLKESELIEKINRYYLPFFEKIPLKNVKSKSISYRPSKNIDNRLKNVAKKLGIHVIELQQYIIDDYINSRGDSIPEDEEKEENYIEISLRHDPNKFNDIKKAAKITGILKTSTYIRRSVLDNLWKCLKCDGRLMKMEMESTGTIACTKCGNKPIEDISPYLKEEKNGVEFIRKVGMSQNEYNEIKEFTNSIGLEVIAFIPVFSHMIAKKDIDNSKNNKSIDKYPKIITDLMFSMQ